MPERGFGLLVRAQSHQKHEQCTEAVTHPSTNVAHRYLATVKDRVIVAKLFFIKQQLSFFCEIYINLFTLKQRCLFQKLIFFGGGWGGGGGGQTKR